MLVAWTVRSPCAAPPLPWIGPRAAGWWRGSGLDRLIALSGGGGRPSRLRGFGGWYFCGYALVRLLMRESSARLPLIAGENCFDCVRVGPSSRHSLVLHRPLGVPPAPAGDAPHSVMPKTVTSGGCAPPHPTWEMQRRGPGVPDHRAVPTGGARRTRVLCQSRRGCSAGAVCQLTPKAPRRGPGRSTRALSLHFGMGSLGRDPSPLRTVARAPSDNGTRLPNPNGVRRCPWGGGAPRPPRPPSMGNRLYGPAMGNRLYGPAMGNRRGCTAPRCRAKREGTQQTRRKKRSSVTCQRRLSL